MELREGDLVVHVAHGVGRYRGLKLLEKQDRTEESGDADYHLVERRCGRFERSFTLPRGRMSLRLGQERADRQAQPDSSPPGWKAPGQC